MKTLPASEQDAITAMILAELETAEGSFNEAQIPRALKSLEPLPERDEIKIIQ